MAPFKKLAVLVVLLAIPALLFAQAQDQGAAQSGDQQQAQGSEEKAEGAEYAQADQQAAGGMTLRLSEAVGITLSSEAGDIQAVPKDAVITLQGDIPFVVVAFSAPADVGQDLYLVPSDRIQAAADGTLTVLNLTAADIQGLQKLEGGQLPAANADQYLASKVQGVAVVDANGQALGTVQDALLDLSTRKIASLAFISTGELGLGAGLFAVPVDRVSGIDTQKGQVTVTMSVEELRASPVE